jgi:hypothetical protein
VAETIHYTALWVLDATNRGWYDASMKTSRWKRYDEKSGLWIASSKPVYGYWFRFLIHAAKDRPDEVDWSLYEDWGGKDYILRTKQNDWWKTKWKTLFGYREGETLPLYPLSTTKPQPDGIRFALMVYKLRNIPLLSGNEDGVDGFVGDKWEIAKRIAVIEYPKHRDRGAWSVIKIDPSYDPDDWMFHYARRSVVKTMRKTDPEEFRKQKRTLQSRIGRYMRQADKHLDSVCKGQFP